MILEILNKIFNFFNNDERNNHDDDDDEEFDSENGAMVPTNVFKVKRIRFGQYSFTTRYLHEHDDVWVVGVDFARGIGFTNVGAAIASFVDAAYVKSATQIISDYDDGLSVKCVNRDGMLQLVNNASLENKTEWTRYLLETFVQDDINVKLNSIQNDLNGKLSQLLRSVNQTNQTMLEHFERRFDDKLMVLNKKMSVYENIDELYQRLRAHHAASAPSPFWLNSNGGGGGDQEQHFNVRLPKDKKKHPRLAVFIKPEGEGTRIAFLSGQHKHYTASKRKYEDMELVYDAVHPNPQLGIHCINEDLFNKNFDCVKKSKRLLHVQCTPETAKFLINENL